MTVEVNSLLYTKGNAIFNVTIKRNGAVVDLTGKSTTGTVRALNDFATTLNLDDQPTTLVDAPNGVIQFTFDASLLSGNPKNALTGLPHTMQFRVVEDDYYPEAIVFGARTAAV